LNMVCTLEGARTETQRVARRHAAAGRGTASDLARRRRTVRKDGATL
jgi:hypothetical protein